jgi:hypothetical protein
VVTGCLVTESIKLTTNVGTGPRNGSCSCTFSRSRMIQEISMGFSRVSFRTILSGIFLCCSISVCAQNANDRKALSGTESIGDTLKQLDQAAHKSTRTQQTVSTSGKSYTLVISDATPALSHCPTMLRGLQFGPVFRATRISLSPTYHPLGFWTVRQERPNTPVVNPYGIRIDGFARS